MPQNVALVRRERTTLAKPDAVLSFRDEILALAGETKSTMAERTRRALVRIDEAMDAVKVTHHTFQGEVVSESVDVDHRARMDGVDRALDLVGARVSKSAQQQASPEHGPINIFIAGLSGPVPVHAEVIEAQPAT